MSETTTQIADKFIREIKILPAWDKRSSEPGKNYGIHSAEILFKLRCPAENSCLVFIVYSGWNLPHLEGVGHKGMGAEVSLHKLALNDAPQDYLSCDFVGGPCKVHGSSGLVGDDCFKLLVVEGSDALWKKLEEIYARWSIE